MPFIGNQPALSYTSFAKQDFTTSATTSYTLDNPVTNANELALFINFVRQEPTTAYSASGTSLTLTSATSATDDMYCVFLGKAVQTVNPPNSSVGNSQLDVSAINSQTAETSIAGGDEVLIYDTSASALKKMTRTNFVSGIGGTNTPAFRACSSSAQSLSSGVTATQQLANENFDTDSCYDTSTYRFTPNVAGKYFVYAECNVDVGNTSLQELYCFIIKNTTLEAQNALDLRSSYFGSDSGTYVATVVDMNGSSDYLEFKVACSVSSGSISALDGTAKRYFGAYKIIT